jgi:hypothetical protein
MKLKLEFFLVDSLNYNENLVHIDKMSRIPYRKNEMTFY